MSREKHLRRLLVATMVCAVAATRCASARQQPASFVSTHDPEPAVRSRSTEAEEPFDEFARLRRTVLTVMALTPAFALATGFLVEWLQAFPGAPEADPVGAATWFLHVGSGRASKDIAMISGFLVAPAVTLFVATALGSPTHRDVPEVLQDRHSMAQFIANVAAWVASVGAWVLVPFAWKSTPEPGWTTLGCIVCALVSSALVPVNGTKARDHARWAWQEAGRIEAVRGRINTILRDNPDARTSLYGVARETHFRWRRHRSPGVNQRLQRSMLRTLPTRRLLASFLCFSVVVSGLLAASLHVGPGTAERNLTTTIGITASIVPPLWIFTALVVATLSPARVARSLEGRTFSRRTRWGIAFFTDLLILLLALSYAELASSWTALCLAFVAGSLAVLLTHRLCRTFLNHAPWELGCLELEMLRASRAHASNLHRLEQFQPSASE